MAYRAVVSLSFFPLMLAATSSMCIPTIQTIVWGVCANISLLMNKTSFDKHKYKYQPRVELTGKTYTWIYY